MTKADDAEFMYLYVTHVTPNTLDMLENSTSQLESVAPLTIAETKIPYSPYSTFSDRIMLKLQKTPPCRHATDVPSPPRRTVSHEPT